MYIYSGEIDVSGKWSTNYKNLTLYQYGDEVYGSYDLLDGVVKGTLDGNILTGMWFQSHTDGDCPYGSFKLIFTGDMFTGKWGYCRNLTDGDWVGRRIDNTR